MMSSNYFAEQPLPHSRMNPPVARTEKEAILTNLLAMFHPRPFILNRFAPQGSAATLRAKNSNYLDIIFR